MRILIAALLLLFSFAADGAELQEKHVELAIDGSNYYGGKVQIPIPAWGRDVYVKSATVTALGPRLLPGQWGWVYVWDQLNQYTVALSMDDMTGGKRESRDFGTDYLKIPAGSYLCLLWWFPYGINSGMYLYADITYFVAP